MPKLTPDSIPFNATSWRSLLLEGPVDKPLRQGLPGLAKQLGHQFLQDHAHLQDPLSSAQRDELDRWYISAEGQQTLQKLTGALWAQMSEFSAYAMPAHDARHAMYKVPATALEYLHAEALQGWERVGLLGALLHDHGRWAEERIFGHPGESVFHARLSFLLGQEVVDRFEMPSLVKQHIVLSALRHTSGANPDDPMPLKLTVSADRDQLYGPEIILRLAHHAPSPDGSMETFSDPTYATSPRSVLGRLSVFLLHRLPGPLFSRQAQVDELWSILLNFVLLAETADDSRSRFQALLAQDRNQKLGSTFDWETQWTAAHHHAAALQCRAHASALDELLAAPHAAPSEHYLEIARCRLRTVAPLSRDCVNLALSYARQELEQQDLRQREALACMTGTDPFIEQFIALTRPAG